MMFPARNPWQPLWPGVQEILVLSVLRNPGQDTEEASVVLHWADIRSNACL